MFQKPYIPKSYALLISASIKEIRIQPKQLPCQVFSVMQTLGY